MKLPTLLRIKGLKKKTSYLQLLKNIYDQKQAGILWNQYLLQDILNIGFEQSDIDKFIFYLSDTILFFCVDDGFLLSLSSKSVERALPDLKDSKKCQC